VAVNALEALLGELPGLEAAEGRIVSYERVLLVQFETMDGNVLVAPHPFAVSVSEEVVVVVIVIVVVVEDNF
jgi:hypothetical protein